MTAHRHAAVVLQAASVCLRYPDDDVRALFPLVERAVPGLSGFVAWAAARSTTELARHYVSVFDQRRRCCLYVTWWTDGETRRRGGALAELKARYRAAGAEFDDHELPDYLPAVLEFGATVDVPGGLALLQEHRAGLELLRLALRHAATPYVAPVEAVCGLLPGPSPQDVATAKALARSGPPREQVGLDLLPYPTMPGGRR